MTLSECLTDLEHHLHYAMEMTNKNIYRKISMCILFWACFLLKVSETESANFKLYCTGGKRLEVYCHRIIASMK